MHVAIQRTVSVRLAGVRVVSVLVVVLVVGEIAAGRVWVFVVADAPGACTADPHQKRFAQDDVEPGIQCLVQARKAYGDQSH